jgi:hypothetical protein
MRGSLLLSSLLVLATSGAAFAGNSVEVTSCGQVVPRKAVGFLTSDLDCTDFKGAAGAVMLEDGADLELRGFQLSGGFFSVLCGTVLESDPTIIDTLSNCEVVGDGGSIVGALNHGILGHRVKASGLTIRDCFEQGIEGSVIKVWDVVVTGNAGDGLRSSGRSSVRDSSVSTNATDGICAETIRLVRSTAIGNGYDLECVLDPCADLRSPRRPRVKESNCGTSLGNPDENGSDWGVCQLD